MRSYKRRTAAQIAKLLKQWAKLKRGQKVAWYKKNGIGYNHIRYWQKHHS